MAPLRPRSVWHDGLAVLMSRVNLCLSVCLPPGWEGSAGLTEPPCPHPLRRIPMGTPAHLTSDGEPQDRESGGGGLGSQGFTHLPYAPGVCRAHQRCQKTLPVSHGVRLRTAIWGEAHLAQIKACRHLMSGRAANCEFRGVLGGVFGGQHGKVIWGHIGEVFCAEYRMCVLSTRQERASSLWSPRHREMPAHLPGTRPTCRGEQTTAPGSESPSVRPQGWA